MRKLCLLWLLLNLVGCVARESGPRWTFSAGQEIASMTFSPDGEILAVSGKDGKIWLLDSQGKTLRELAQGPKEPHLHFSSDGLAMASSSQFSRSVAWWNVTDGKLVTSIDIGKAGKAAELVYHEAVLVVHASGGVTGVNSYVGGEQGSSVSGVAFASAGSLLTTDNLGSVQYWNPEGEMTQLLRINTGVTLSKLSPKGDLLALSGSNRLTVIKVPSGDRAFELTSNGTFEPVVFSPDGKYLASSSFGKTKLISLAGSATASSIDGGSRAFDFSSDSRYLASAGDTIKVTNVLTKALEGELRWMADDIAVLEDGQGVLLRGAEQLGLWRLKDSDRPGWLLEKPNTGWAVSSKDLVAVSMAGGGVECWEPLTASASK